MPSPKTDKCWYISLTSYFYVYTNADVMKPVQNWFSFSSILLFYQKNYSNVVAHEAGSKINCTNGRGPLKNVNLETYYKASYWPTYSSYLQMMMMTFLSSLSLVVMRNPIISNVWKNGKTFCRKKICLNALKYFAFFLKLLDFLTYLNCYNLPWQL